MNQIINRKRYDTLTATEVATYWNGLGRGDLRNVSEKLYRKKTGEFFLSGEGGAMTEYSKSNGNISWGSSDIIPLTLEKAQQWVEEKANSSYESIFGAVEE